MSKYYRIAGRVVFPEGLAAGEGRSSNSVTIARNGEGKPVLRGTSIAGALRSALLNWGVSKEIVSFWFGDKLESKQDFAASQVIVSDMILDVGEKVAEFRTHNKINRHTGTVVDNALFDIEILPPSTSGNLLLYVVPREDCDDSLILKALENVFAETLLLGGNKNRGIGRMDASKVQCHAFDCSTVEGFADWQDIRYADRIGANLDVSKFEKVAFGVESSSDKVVFDVQLKIPRGEDISVGYGKDLEGNLGAQQYVFNVEGEKFWRIPGSTFRGVFRGWMTRLAVLEGASDRENLDSLQDPIVDLFGSLEQKGRIHFSDAYCGEAGAREQSRTHVAIDRFSGGSNPGALFKNKVLVGEGQFALNISVEQPKAKELGWLKKTLLALHLGVISVGSSKASGLLEIENWDNLKSELENEIAKAGKKAEV